MEAALTEAEASARRVVKWWPPDGGVRPTPGEVMAMYSVPQRVS